MLTKILYFAYVALVIWALYDLFTGGKPRDKKIIWALVLIFVPFGLIIYFFFGR